MIRNTLTTKAVDDEVNKKLLKSNIIGNTIVLIGDSITKNNSDMLGESGYNDTLPHAQYFNVGWFNVANTILNQQFNIIKKLGS